MIPMKIPMTYEELLKEYGKLKNKYAAVNEYNKKLEKWCIKSLEEKEELQEEHKKLQEEHKDLKDAYNNLRKRNTNIEHTLRPPLNALEE